MKICLISSQFFSWGKYGGFGSMTRKLSTRLASDGHDVYVTTLKRGDQKKNEIIDGVKVIGISGLDLFSTKIYKDIDADLYHSQEPSLGSYLAMKAQPDKKHVITCRDPRDLHDFLIEFQDGSWKKRVKIPFVYFYEGGPFIKYAVRNADVVGVPANFLMEKTKNLYGLDKDPILLPNLLVIPETIPEKSATPVVCFVGRFDKRKRPELFLELASKFPDVKFIMVGKSEEMDWDIHLRNKYSNQKNLTMVGFINRFESNKLYEIYSESWILINTSSREGLPLTFVEAAGYGCAVLSSVNPDNFASEFGFFCENDDFEAGLTYLLKNDNWKSLGRKAYEYVKNVYDEEVAIKKHLDVYKSLLKNMR